MNALQQNPDPAVWDEIPIPRDDTRYIHSAEDLQSSDNRSLAQRLFDKAPDDWNPWLQAAVNIPQSMAEEGSQLIDFLHGGLKYGASILNYYNPYEPARQEAQKFYQQHTQLPSWDEIQAAAEGLKQHYWDQGYRDLVTKGVPGPNMVKNPASYLIDGLGAGLGAAKLAKKVKQIKAAMMNPGLKAASELPQEVVMKAAKEAPLKTLDAADTAEGLNKPYAKPQQTPKPNWDFNILTGPMPVLDFNNSWLPSGIFSKGFDALWKHTQIKSGKKKQLNYSVVNPNEAAKLHQDLGIDLTGFTRSIDDSGINHVIKNHGNSKVEEARGQVAITKKHFKLIPSIIKNYDSIILETNKIGRPVIRYRKNIGGSYYVVEEVRTGRKELSLQTLWKTKPKNIQLP